MPLRRTAMRRGLGRAALWACCAGAFAGVPAGAAAAPAPIVSVSVATKAGVLVGPIAVRAKQTTLRVDGRRCTVAAGTPLAALIALRAKAKAPAVGSLTVRDYGGCGKRPSSSARLYLTAIGADRASGPDGWIYAVGDRSGSTGAADPAGPFSKGRLKAGSDVAWRWCRASEDPDGDCGDALQITGVTQRGEVLSAGAAPFDVRVVLRASQSDGGTGTAAPAPAGTVINEIDPSGRIQSTGTITSADGIVRMSLDVQPPRGTRLVATAPAPTIAPTGWLWPRLP
jgi:hypothetical protein